MPPQHPSGGKTYTWAEGNRRVVKKGQQASDLMTYD